MKRSFRHRYMEKFEALDFAAGTYHSRQLPRTRYNGNDFLDYLSTLDMMDLTDIDEAESAFMEGYDTA